jgi:hypothetical protein
MRVVRQQTLEVVVNRDLILSQLKEAHEELTRTIAEIEQDPEYDFGEYLVAMMHLYHHINTAWNARDTSPERAQACTKEDFEVWAIFHPILTYRSIMTK